MSDQRDILERLRDPLHGTELRIEAADEIASLRADKETAMRHVEAIGRDATAEIASLRAQVDALNDDIHQIGQEREDLRAQLAEAQEANMANLAAAKELGYQMHEVKAQLADAQGEIVTHSICVDRLSRQLASLKKALAWIDNHDPQIVDAALEKFGVSLSDDLRGEK